MKKLLISSLALAFGLAVQAAAVDWNSGTSSDGFKNPNGQKITSAMGYVMTVTFFSDSLGTTKLVESTGKLNAFPGSFSANVPGSGTDYFTAGTTYYVSAIIKNDEYTRSTDIEAFTIPDYSDANLNFTLGTGFDIVGDKWGDWETVPEPFSGTLALLGMGVVALRRKLKKAKKA